MEDEQVYTREEIEGALLSKYATDAVIGALRDPGNKSKPTFAMAEEIIQAAIEAGFGPK